MALAVRIIPTLLCRGRQLVKGQRFNAWRSVGVAAQAVRIHQMRGVDELCLLDIGATPEGRGPDLSLIEELTAHCFMPLSVGGGVRSIEDARALLNAGADKIVVHAETRRRPEIIRELADHFGRQAIVVAVDVEESLARAPDTNPISWALRCEDLGAGEILLTSVDREGSMLGYDLRLVEYVATTVSIPVIAHGGCGTYQNMLEAINAGADAVAAGAMFQFTDQTPKGAAEFLKSHGVEVRV